MLTDVLIRPGQKRAERSDDDLMRDVRRGDQKAFRDLYDRYKAQIFLYCLRMTNERELARDVLQEIFIRVHENREKYEIGTNFGGWIHTIARNLCLNATRTRRDTVSFDESLGTGRTAKKNDPDVLLRERLAEEIAALPDIYRESLVLREYEGYSYKQIAEIIKQPMSTVKFRIFKAREILRERLSLLLDDLNEE